MDIIRPFDVQVVRGEARWAWLHAIPTTACCASVERINAPSCPFDVQVARGITVWLLACLTRRDVSIEFFRIHFSRHSGVQVVRGEARWAWLHAIPHDGLMQPRRVSITLRQAREPTR